MLNSDNIVQKWSLPSPMTLLQIFGLNPLGSLLLAPVVPLVVVAFGTYWEFSWRFSRSSVSRRGRTSRPSERSPATLRCSEGGRPAPVVGDGYTLCMQHVPSLNCGGVRRARSHGLSRWDSPTTSDTPRASRPACRGSCRPSRLRGRRPPPLGRRSGPPRFRVHPRRAGTRHAPVGRPAAAC